MKNNLKHAISFDIEDWFHIIDIDNKNNIDSFGNVSIVENYTIKILDLLDKHKTKATFFILGIVAKNYPDLVSEIARRQHEIASHSYSHKLIYRMSASEFKLDTLKSIEVLEKITNKKVEGYRAPSFSITDECLWAFKVLRDCGITWDASIFPQRRDNGGMDFIDNPVDLKNTEINVDIKEFPMRLFRIGKLGFCFSGGGYFRLLPRHFIKYAFDYFEKRNQPCITYLHPRDFCTNIPNHDGTILRKLKTSIGTATTLKKLDFLLENYKFSICSDVLMSYLEK